MPYYSPDLTGSLPDYAVTADIYTVFTNYQRIDFGTSVFLNSLSIHILGAGSPAFVYNTDWTIVDTIDIDYTEMSRMKNIDPTFNASLIKSIIVISPTTLPYKITCAYQQLYPVPSSIAVSQNGAVELTPDLITDILNKVSNLQLVLSGVPSTVATSTANPKLLAVDVNETNSANLISGEIQTVNVFQNQNVIRPTCGSFFPDSVILTSPGSSTPWVEGTDYVFFGADLPKIKMTTNTSGVYNFILVLKQYAGNVNLTYHAFGGDVTLYDMNALYTELYNITNYLGNSNFLTASSFGSNPVVLGLINRIATLESEMRNLINSGSPNYSDATGNGTSIVTKIRSVDENLHWWTIASLYQVAGSSAVVVADRMYFRIQLLNANLAADVYVNVNLNLENPYTIDSISVNQDLGYVPFTSYGTDLVVTPQFRIIYNTGEANASGILLQVGLRLASLTETISIQDLSGSESAWILASGSSVAILPQDGMVTMPNTAQTWDPTYGYSQQITHLMPNKTGYLAWGGAQALSGMSTGGTTLTALIDKYFVLSDITKIRLEFTEGDTTHLFTLDIPVGSYDVATTVSGSGLLQNTPTDNTYIIFGVSLSIVGTTITLTITPSIIPSTTTLTLRHVLLLLN